MAKNVTETIVTNGTREIFRRLPASKISAATRKAGKVFIEDIWRARTLAGLDVAYKRLPKLTKQYEKFKKRFIRGKMKRIPRALRVTTDWKAKGLPNHGRLSGQLFSSVKSEVVQGAQFRPGEVTATFNIIVDGQRNTDLFKFLKDMRRDIRPILSTNPGRRAQELEKIKEFYIKELNLKTATSKGK